MSVDITVHGPKPAIVRDIKNSACWLRIPADGEVEVNVCFNDLDAVRDWLRAALVEAVCSSDRISSDCQRGLEMIEKAGKR